MPLDTTKSVKSITYNGTNVPLYAKSEQTKTVDLTMSSGNQTISPDSGKVLSSVTINKPSTLVAENIKKDVNIGGVVGTLESGGGSSSSSETWVINDCTYTSVILPEEALETGEVTFQISFTSNNLTFSSISMREDTDNIYDLYYDETAVGGGRVITPNNEWFIYFNNEMYRKLTFSTAPTGDLLTWLQNGAVKQTSGTAIQLNKTLTVTSNGTTTITPDVPYDAIEQVDLTVNVANSGGNVTTTLTIECSDENSYGLPLLITYQTNNGKMYQAYNAETMSTDSGSITLQNVLIDGICIISIPTETTAWLTTSLNANVNAEKIEVNDAIGSETLTKVMAYKITGVNAKILIRLMAS